MSKLVTGGGNWSPVAQTPIQLLETCYATPWRKPCSTSNMQTVAAASTPLNDEEQTSGGSSTSEERSEGTNKLARGAAGSVCASHLLLHAPCSDDDGQRVRTGLSLVFSLCMMNEQCGRDSNALAPSQQPPSHAAVGSTGAPHSPGFLDVMYVLLK
jgi:hypothetical protein